MTTRDALEAALVAELAERGGRCADPVLLAQEVADRLRLVEPVEVAAVAFKPRRYDLRGEQDYRYPGGRKKARIRSGGPVHRDPAEVSGIVIHQTAVEFGTSARQRERSGGDDDLALARRGLDVACHAIAFRRGIYAVTHPLAVHVNHGNALNAKTLGLEIDGRYAGLEDDPSTVAREDLATTWGGTPTQLSERTVETAREALRFLVEEGRALGMPILDVWAHRQSSLTRRSDPGAAIWRAVVLDYAVPCLGLRVHNDTIVGSGYTIPTAWDPSASGDY